LLKVALNIIPPMIVLNLYIASTFNLLNIIFFTIDLLRNYIASKIQHTAMKTY
jgi:hypothetical protein